VLPKLKNDLSYCGENIQEKTAIEWFRRTVNLNDDATDEFIQIIEFKNQEDLAGLEVQIKDLLSKILGTDKEEVINLLQPNQIFGNNLIFSSSPYFLGDIISLTNSKILFINKSNLLTLFKNNEKFLCKYLESISNQIMKEKNKAKVLVHKNIRDRILYYITNESKRKGQVKIKSIADLARELSLPRPSVSREIYKLINENIISYNNKILTIK
jgi:CRP-like cAMP-binding protein